MMQKDTLNKFKLLFFWLKIFYPKTNRIPFYFMIWTFGWQKILRINGSVPWPVHFTSRVLYHRNIKIGNRTAPGMNSGCYIQGRGGIEIGHNFRLAPNCGLISANHSIDDYDTWDQIAPIKIGNNVWIGMNSVVLPGVTIGDNVVIGAGSIVTKDIPSNSIAVGAPCKVIKQKSEYKGIDYGKLRSL